MKIELASIKITVARDIARQMNSVQVYLETDPNKEEDLINGIAEALISHKKLKDIFNKAVRRANEIRASGNN